MPCGCASTSTGPVDLSKLLTCHMCIWAEHGPSAMNDGAISCTIDNKPVVGRQTCPKGKWRAVDGVTDCKSLGVWHYGAPWWQRILVWALKRTHPKYGAFPFCGCVKPLKDLWDRGHTRSH